MLFSRFIKMSCQRSISVCVKETMEKEQVRLSALEDILAIIRHDFERDMRYLRLLERRLGY